MSVRAHVLPVCATLSLHPMALQRSPGMIDERVRRERLFEQNRDRGLRRQCPWLAIPTSRAPAGCRSAGDLLCEVDAAHPQQPDICDEQVESV
jgi:hypothetical protein